MTQVILSLLLFLYIITANLLYFVEINSTDANIKSYGDALWLTAITFATIGYGDRFAVTSLGRIITVIAATGGIALYAGLGSALLTAISILVQKAEAGELGVPVKNHAIICNWQEEAGTLARELLSGDTPINDIIIISRGERPFEEKSHLHFVSGNPSDESTLQRANISQASAVIVFPPEEEALQEGEIADSLSLMQFSTVNALTPKLWHGIFLQREENRKHFNSADAVINPARLGAMMMAQAFQDPGVEVIVNRLLSNLEGHTLFRTHIPSRFVRRAFGDLYEIPEWIPVALVRHGQVTENPNKGTVLEATDDIIVIAPSRPVVK